VISFYGAKPSSSSYSLYQSPDIDGFYVLTLPDSYLPTIDVTPTVSYWDGTNWSAPTAVGQSQSYVPNDAIDLYALGSVSDEFYAETDQNSHSAYYNYKVTFDGNIDMPTGDATGLDFYSSADFSACTTSNPASATMVGYNGWTFNESYAYSSNSIISVYIQYYGDILFTMPENFMGTSVNVTVTSSTGNDGAGSLYVNDVLHTFTAGETYTWTVPVSANGTIEFKANATDDFTNTYSIDFTQIVISSGNGSSMNAPAQAISKPMTLKYKNSRHYPNMPEPIGESKHECDNIIRIND